MPSRTPKTPGRVPRRLPLFRLLPKSEVLLIEFLISCVGRCECAFAFCELLFIADIRRLKLSIGMPISLGELIDVEIYRAIGFISVPVIDNLFDEVDDFRNVF